MFNKIMASDCATSRTQAITVDYRLSTVECRPSNIYSRVTGYLPDAAVSGYHNFFHVSARNPVWAITGLLEMATLPVLGFLRTEDHVGFEE